VSIAEFASTLALGLLEDHGELVVVDGLFEEASVKVVTLHVVSVVVSADIAYLGQNSIYKSNLGCVAVRAESERNRQAVVIEGVQNDTQIYD